VVRLVDPDSWRDEIRQARERDDTATLEELLRTPSIDQVPSATLRTIGARLPYRGNQSYQDFLRRAVLDDHRSC
jgi:hypothetical protein